MSKRVLIATMVAAAAVIMARHPPTTSPGLAQAQASSVIATSFR